MILQGKPCIIARVEAPSPKQAELPFSEEEKIVVVIDSNRHLEEQVAALKEEIARLRAQLFGKKSERMATGYHPD